MSNTMTGAVAAVSSKDVKTKFGMKKVYSFKLDSGAWYKTGFKDVGVRDGDVVTFMYNSGTYGDEVVEGSVMLSGKVSTSAISDTSYVSPPPRNVSSGKGVFPIPALDGQRAIVRQNALTNARETIDCILRVQQEAGVISAPRADAMEDSAVAERIILVARIYEAYACGDSDMEEAVKEFEAKGS